MRHPEPTAEGTLAKTPLAHLLVYALERRLTGSLKLVEAGGAAHVLRLTDGSVDKVRLANEQHLLGQMLVQADLISEETLQGALETQGRLGDVLVLCGHVDAEDVERLVVEQFKRRLVGLFALPEETAFQFFEKTDLLKELALDPVSLDAFQLVWLGIEAHAPHSALFEATLGKLPEDAPLRIHERASTDRFEMEGEARQVLDLIVLDPAPFSELLDIEDVPAEVVRRVVYTLMILRQIVLGKETLPVEPARDPNAPAASAVARVQLRSKLMRVGGPTPEPVGEAAAQPASSTSEEAKPTASAAATTEPTAERPPSADDSPSGIVSVAGTAGIAAEDSHDDPASGQREVPATASEGDDYDPSLYEGLDSAALRRRCRLAVAAKDFKTARHLCRAWREREPGTEVAAIDVWVRANDRGAPIKLLVLELDELLRSDEGSAEARFYRGVLRRRLGNDDGARSDLERVLAADPSHAGAQDELARLSPRPRDKEAGGLFSRWFRR